MPIQAPTVAPVVQLPVTGVDPTAAAAAAPVVAAPVVVAPVLSAADADLIEATKAQFAGNAAGATVPSEQAATPESTTAGDTAPTPELTPSQKIAAKIEAKKAQIVKLTGEVERLEAQFRSADLLDSVKQGSIIVARVGRAETAREVTASVIGVQTLESGDVRYKIYFGEGFDAETVVIQSSQIIDVKQV